MEVDLPHTGALSISLFGPLVVEIDGAPAPKPRTRATHWCLARLLLQRGRAIARDRLAEELWPESDSIVANGNLRRCLTDLRNMLGDAGRRIESPSRAEVRFDASGADIDLFDFDAWIGSQDASLVEGAAALYRKPFLKGCQATWADVERSDMAARLRKALDRVAAQACADGRFSVAAGLRSILIELDPLNEEAVAGLMDALASIGNHERAAAVYRDLRARLARTVGAKPDHGLLSRYLRARSLCRSKPGAERGPRRGNVPGLRKPLIGRDEAVVSILARLSTARFVTLVGPGGVGKTQLAIRVATEADEEFPDGAFFADLSDATCLEEVVSTVAAILGGHSDRVDEEAVLRSLGGKTSLLVMDNCEQLVQACQRLAHTLLDRCPNVRILATSRSSLRLTAEWQWPVPPLAFPAAGPTSDLSATAAESESALRSLSAVEMFLSEATRARGEFEPTHTDLECIGRICIVLEGLPLAIEMAAAWARTLSFAEIERKLADPLSMLVSDARAGPARHRSIAGILNRTDAMLLSDEQRLWREVALFSGGWTLEAMEKVCSNPAPGRSLIMLLDRLIDLSVVTRADVRGTTRYGMPETVRSFAARRLPRATVRNVRDRHLTFYAGWAESVAPRLTGPDQSEWLDRLAYERANLRNALEYAEQSRSSFAGLHLACALWRFWYVRGDCDVGRRWIEMFAEMADGAEPNLLLTAAGAAGNLAYRNAHYSVARRHYARHLDLSRQLDLPRGVASALGNLGNVAADEGSEVEARACFEECARAFQQLGDGRGAALALGNLAISFGRTGEFDEALRCHAKSIDYFREAGDAINLAMALANLAETQLLAGQPYRAHSPLVEALCLASELGTARYAGRCLVLSVSLAVALGRLDDANVLAGAVDRLKSNAEMPVSPAVWTRYGSDVETLTSKLNPEAFAAALARGRGMTIDAVARLVRSIGADPRC